MRVSPASHFALAYLSTASPIFLAVVYSGNYDTMHNTQIVNVEELLRSRTNSAAAVASKALDFRVELPSGFKRGELTIQIDTYVFGHIANK